MIAIMTAAVDTHHPLLSGAERSTVLRLSAEVGADMDWPAQLLSGSCARGPKGNITEVCIGVVWRFLWLTMVSSWC